MNYLSYLNADKTCILLLNNHIIYESTENGVKPLIKYLSLNGLPPKNTILIDKVIGYAIANAVIYCEITTVYTKIISKPALELLTNHNVNVNYELLVANIMRKDNTDICPLEKKILASNSVVEAINILNSHVNKQ